MRSEYVITMPNMYARGILFGKMVIELGDACTAHNDAQDLHADLEFKTKGFFSGTYNAIAGRVRHGPTDLGEVSGRWSALMEFKSTKVCASHFYPFPLQLHNSWKQTGEKRTLFDVQKDGSAIAPKWVAPEDEQEPYESRRLWRDLTRALGAKDMDAATNAKGAVENAQRELRAAGAKHTTRFFELRDNRWAPRILCVHPFLLNLCVFIRGFFLQASGGSTGGYGCYTGVDMVWPAGERPYDDSRRSLRRQTKTLYPGFFLINCLTPMEGGRVYGYTVQPLLATSVRACCTCIFWLLLLYPHLQLLYNAIPSFFFFGNTIAKEDIVFVW